MRGNQAAINELAKNRYKMFSRARPVKKFEPVLFAKRNYGRAPKFNFPENAQ